METNHINTVTITLKEYDELRNNCELRADAGKGYIEETEPRDGLEYEYKSSSDTHVLVPEPSGDEFLSLPTDIFTFNEKGACFAEFNQIVGYLGSDIKQFPHFKKFVDEFNFIYKDLKK